MGEHSTQIYENTGFQYFFKQKPKSISIINELEISQKSLLETVTTASLVTLDPPNYILPPLDISRSTKPIKQDGNIK